MEACYGIEVPHRYGVALCNETSVSLWFARDNKNYSPEPKTRGHAKIRFLTEFTMIGMNVLWMT